MIRRGLGLPRLGRSGAWSPLSLAEAVAYYDINRMGTLWQDTSATTAVAAADDPVGRVDAVGPVGAPALLQGTATERPLYKVVDGVGVVQGDSVDDALEVALPSGTYEAWVNTPHGHFRTQAVGDADHAPLANTSQYFISNTLTAAQRSRLSSYFATPERFFVWLMPDTTIAELRAYAGGATTQLLFVGANGVEVTKDLSLNSKYSFDVSSDGLTAPVAVVCDAFAEGITVWLCDSNQCTGPLPDISALTSLTAWQSRDNQFTGPLPDISALTSLMAWNSGNNQLTGWAGGTVPATLGDFRAHINLLPEATVDALLAAFVAAGRTSDDGTCLLHLYGTGNAAPSAAGAADKATLVSRGWTVATN